MLTHKFSQLSAIILLWSLVALAQESPKPAAPPRQEVLLTEIRDLLAKRQ